jgi:hypothetical protein
VDNNTRTCQNCIAYVSINVNGGICHMHPPTPFIAEQRNALGQSSPQVVAFHPSVPASGHCQEFIQKPVKLAS